MNNAKCMCIWSLLLVNSIGIGGKGLRSDPDSKALYQKNFHCTNEDQITRTLYHINSRVHNGKKAHLIY